MSRSRLRLSRRAGYALALVAIVGSIAAAALALATARALLPLPDTLAPVADAPARMRFVDRNGVPLNTSYETEWNLHDRLALHEIPTFLRLAFVHAEDKRFYEHRGPDWIARSSALVTNLRHLDSIRGASTITEQVVRMLHPRPRTVWSRWLEGFEAARLERRFGKDEILAFYLNQVPYASRRRGVRQAAELYFARDLETLSDREMLSLAVLVRSPSRLDLRDDPEASTAAVERLADAMLERGALSGGRHHAILAHPVVLASSSLVVDAPHFLRFAAGEAAGLFARTRVGTTLDARLQARIQSLLDTRMAALETLGVENGAVLVADNATGEVLAWVVAGGGKAGSTGHIDPVTTARQPGSALKPFLYALALENGRTLADVIVDAPLAEGIGNGLHRYRNYSERHYGPVSLRDALANSLNIPAVKLLNDLGAGAYLDHLEALGIRSLNEHPGVYGDGLALGNGEVTLYELVQAYVALANRGRAQPLRVLSAPVATAPRRAIVSPETASLIANALSDADARAAEFGRDSVLSLPVQTAVKTGTSSDYRDAWAIGFDARFTVGVWMGNLDQSPTNGVTGSIGPALLLRSVFAHLNRDGNSLPLHLSPRLAQRSVCVPAPLSGGEDCLVRAEWFDPMHDDGARPVGTEVYGRAAIEPIRMRQPTGGLELAFDPRLPADAQAFRFLLDGVEPDDRVEWRIDGETHEASGPAYVWTVARGTHRVGAEVSRQGATIASLAPVDFVVR
jgi:penicillin-binding protein 1C